MPRIRLPRVNIFSLVTLMVVGSLAVALNVFSVAYHADRDPLELTLVAAIAVAFLSFVLGMNWGGWKWRRMYEEFEQLREEAMGRAASVKIEVVPSPSGLMALVSLGDDVHTIALPDDYNPERDGGQRLNELVSEWFTERELRLQNLKKQKDA